VFFEASLIVDDENPGKPTDYVEALESVSAVMHYQLETLGIAQCQSGRLVVNSSAAEGGWKQTMTNQERNEQATPPKAKLNQLVSFNKGRFGGPTPKSAFTIRDVADERYGQGYRE